MARGRTLCLTPPARPRLRAWQRATTISAGRAQRGHTRLRAAEWSPMAQSAAMVENRCCVGASHQASVSLLPRPARVHAPRIVHPRPRRQGCQRLRGTTRDGTRDHGAAMAQAASPLDPHPRARVVAPSRDI